MISSLDMSDVYVRSDTIVQILNLYRNIRDFTSMFIYIEVLQGHLMSFGPYYMYVYMYITNTNRNIFQVRLLQEQFPAWLHGRYHGQYKYKYNTTS